MSRSAVVVDASGDTCDVVYSPDDAAETGRGWYAQRWRDDATSRRLYSTREEAKSDLRAGRVEWES